MKNVLIDMHRLKHNPFNGLYTFSKHFGDALIQLLPNNSDLDFTFYAPKDKQDIFGNAIKYENHKSIDKYFKWGTNKYDIWHITTTISWYKSFSKKTKHVFTLHDLSFLIENKNEVERNKKTLRLIQERIDNAEYITAISQFVLDYSKQYLNFKNKPTQVVYNGCNFSNAALALAPKTIPNNPFLFTIGLVQPRKNFHTLPALLVGNNYMLLIAGIDTFNYKQEIINEAKKHCVENRLVFLGAINEAEKIWYYINCLAFLFPSYAEGFGLPILEAMQFGKPVFISAETSLPEVGGEAAYYFNNFEPKEMHQVFIEGMHHYESSKPFEKIIKQSQKFNWNNTAQDYIDIYRQLL